MGKRNLVYEDIVLLLSRLNKRHTKDTLNKILRELDDYGGLDENSLEVIRKIKKENDRNQSENKS